LVIEHKNIPPFVTRRACARARVCACVRASRERFWTVQDPSDSKRLATEWKTGSQICSGRRKITVYTASGSRAYRV